MPLKISPENHLQEQNVEANLLGSSRSLEKKKLLSKSYGLRSDATLICEFIVHQTRLTCEAVRSLIAPPPALKP